MKLKIEIDMNHSAFEDNVYEVRHILEPVLEELESEFSSRQDLPSFVLRDTNGNQCGMAWTEE